MAYTAVATAVYFWVYAVQFNFIKSEFIRSQLSSKFTETKKKNISVHNQKNEITENVEFLRLFHSKFEGNRQSFMFNIAFVVYTRDRYFLFIFFS